MLETRTFSLPRRNPNISASDDSPSSTSIAPFSTLAFHSTEAGAPARTTKILARPAACCCRPIEERICGQAPGSSESTAKYGSVAAAATAHAKTQLTSKRIPDPGPHVAEVRTFARFVNEIDRKSTRL